MLGLPFGLQPKVELMTFRLRACVLCPATVRMIMVYLGPCIKCVSGQHPRRGAVRLTLLDTPRDWTRGPSAADRRTALDGTKMERDVFSNWGRNGIMDSGQS